MKKRTLIRTALMTVVAVMALILNAQTEKVNLAENGNFEDGVQKWDGKGVADTVEFKDGKSSMKLDGSGTPVFIADAQDITTKLKPSTEYVLSADIKRTVIDKGSVYVAVLEKAKNTDKDWLPGHVCGGQGQAGKWEHFEVKFKTGSEIGHAIIILYNITTGGIAWYDNISLVEVK